MSDLHYLRVSGTEYELGLQQGELLKDEIHNSYRELTEADEIKYVSPPLIPQSILIKLAKHRASNILKKTFQQTLPNKLDRLYGLSDGARISFDKLLLLQGLEIYLNDISYTTKGCSSVGFETDRVNLNEPVIIKNFDYISRLTKFAKIRYSQPSFGFNSLDITYSSIIGTHDGMNEHGLVLVYNYGLTREKVTHAIPLTILIQEALETCRTVDEVLDLLSDREFANGAILTIGDSSGSIKILEISPHHTRVRAPENGILPATNFYLSEHMSEFNIPSDAYYKDNTPPEFRGRRIQQTNELRYERLVELTAGANIFSDYEFYNILKDHSGLEQGTDDTICRHDVRIGTSTSIIFYLRSKKLRVYFGNPCQAKGEYPEYGF